MGEPERNALGGLTPWVALGAFAVYVATASATPYLLDSAELAAAGFGLGVAHPPGEPLALLWAKLFTWLPLGSVAFRVSVSQAVAGAGAAALVYHLARALVTALGGGLGRVAEALLALAAVAGFGLAPGVILSSNRPEVYALATLLALAALVAAIEGGPRGALLAALLIGLGVANHPLIAGMAGLGAVAAALPHLWRSPELPRGRWILAAVAAFVVGALVIAYLPARAAALAGGASPDTIDWGDGRSLGGLWWILSARTFVGKAAVVHGAADPTAAPFLFIEEIGLALALLAPVGLLYGLRVARARPLTLPLAVAGAGSLLAALAGGLDPANPDIRGYLGIAIAVAALFGAAGAAVLATATRRTAIATALAAALALGVCAHVATLSPAIDLRTSRAADGVGDRLQSELPPRAAVLTAHFETAFVLAYQRLVEGRRPDVAWAHLGFVRGPGYVARLGAAYPALAPLLAAHQAGPLPLAAAQLLSRPLAFEPDVHLAPDLRAALAPADLLWRLPPRGGPPPHDQPMPAPWLDEAARDRQVRGFLGYRAYADAQLACERGLRTVVRARFGELRALLPQDDRVHTLASTCDAAARGR